jgi:modulator of FtsH protease HflK
MSWGPKGNFPGGNDQGPWGRPRPSSGGGGGSSGGSGGGNGGGRRTPPGGGDFDEFFRRKQEQFNSFFGGNSGDNYRPALIFGAALGFIWLLSGVYTVDPSEQGVELIFGKVHETTGPGLHYNFPSPIGTVFTPEVTTSKKEEIGFTTRGTQDERADVPEESIMLTGDKNLVKVHYEVQWKVNDAAKFLFSVRNPELSVKPVAESAMREVVGNTPIDTVLSNEKERIALETRQLMQNVLDSYDTGIQVERVVMLEADAPSAVVDAFIDVLAAQQEFTTLQERARKYEQGIIPVAQGEAQKMILDAEAYKQEVVNRAKGDASRFLSVYNEYRQAEDVTRKRMYLETMEEILAGMPKVIIDGDAGGSGVLPYMALPPLRSLEPASGGNAGAGGAR